MNNSEYFSELNIQRLKVCAHKWARQHPVIKKVLLCACAEAGPKYLILIEDPKLPKKNPKRTRNNRDSEPIYTDATKEDPLFFDKINFFNWTSEDCLHIREDLSTVYKDEDRFDLHNWMWWNLEEDEDLPEFIVKEYIFKLYERKEYKGITNVGKKLRPNQRHKNQCRKIAAEIWENEPNVTIADMILRDEIHKACETKTYAESTLRDWIKDLAPDRSPGRRPEKK
jgi:hypothetical protein